MLSEVDKWSQKYMIYRKGAALFIALLIISVIVFFANLSTVKVSTVCLVSCFICVMGIRWCLNKMDEFKSLYVNTVPMIDPEKDFSEEKFKMEQSELEESLVEEQSSVVEVMESFVEEEVPFEEALSVSVEPIDVDELNQEIEQVLNLDQTEVLDEVEQTKQNEEEVLLAGEVPFEEALSVSVEPIDVDELNQEIEQVLNLDQTEVLDEVEETEQNEEEVLLAEFLVNEEHLINQNEIELPTEEISSLSIEEQIVDLVSRLIQTQYPLSNELTFKTVGNYFTIYSNKKVLMRLKLTGRKQYILTHLTQDEVEALGYEWEAPSKSEAYESRVKYTGLEVLEGLEAHICDLYKRCHKL